MTTDSLPDREHREEGRAFTWMQWRSTRTRYQQDGLRVRSAVP